ncbi:CHAP domain-containing protein [Actinosynnema sp. NPDC023587]|uniref:CHAP domain-containing protein n=1 Tax=Actinosynnema sp. NPDC023587 TaxID=3154695 RepID=UPI0033CE7BE5
MTTTTDTTAAPTGTRRVRAAAAGALLAMLLGMGSGAGAAIAHAQQIPAVSVAADRAVGQTTDHNTAPYGQCTWGAYEKFHQATGLWPLIMGNAADMDDNARARGWTVVLDAQPRAMVVFEPGIHGADPTYGHVAWVDEVISQAGTTPLIRITETNAGGAWGEFTTRTVQDVVGMSYILAP